MPIQQDLQKLEPGAIVELFVLDATAIGGGITRMHNGVNGIGSPVVWQGQTYSPFPIEAKGFETSGQGKLPRPTVSVANVTGVIGALVRDLNDLLGAKFTRKRTLAKYLDAVNFTGGVNPSADPTAALPDDVYFVDRKASENKVAVTFELAASFDVAGVQLPRRVIVQNVCPWTYRSAECGYTGTVYFDRTDTPVGSLAQDVCGKRLSSCKARFGQNAELPFRGFPAAGLVRRPGATKPCSTRCGPPQGRPAGRSSWSRAARSTCRAATRRWATTSSASTPRTTPTPRTAERSWPWCIPTPTARPSPARPT